MAMEFEDDLHWDDLEEQLRVILPEALEDGGKYIGEKADEKTPVLIDVKRANKKRRQQVGYLRDSRFVRVEGLLQVAIGYAAYWARWQHEREDYHHETGEWKWLERTLASEGFEALKRVANRIQEGLGMK